MRFFYVFCLLFLPLVQVWAFPWPEKAPKRDKKAFYQFQLEGRVMRFLNEARFRPFVGAHFKAQDPFFYVDTSYTYSVAEQAHYFRPKEFYVNLPALEGGEWIIGRRRLTWNLMDTFWNRSLWEPSYRDDALRPEGAGLMGVFRDFHYDEGSASLFGSFLFLPDSSHSFENEQGRLTSNSPWFTPPPSGPIGSTAISPYYIMNPVDLKRFLSLSLGGRANYQNFYFAYAFKPMNKIKLKSQVLLALSEELKGNHKTGYSVEVPLDPVILNHHLLSGGFVFRSRQKGEKAQNINYNFITSFTYNHPEEHTVQNDTWIFFSSPPELHVSIKGELHVKDPMEETTLHVAYTHHFPFEEEPLSALSKALPEVEKQFFRAGLFEFSRAVSTGIQHRIQMDQNYSADIKARLIYNVLHSYFLFSAHGAVNYKKNFSVFLSSDLLFSRFPFSTGQTRENIGIYTNKSRVFGGISYAF